MVSRIKRVVKLMSIVTIMLIFQLPITLAQAPGDANGDGQINILDVTVILNDILEIAPAPGNGDCNNDGQVNILDVTCVLNIILEITPEPTPTPGPPPTNGGRFMDNGDGTVTDNQTGLMWEKKVVGPFGSCLDDDKLHSVDATCDWFDAKGAWITKLNNTCNNDPSVDCSAGGGDADCINAGGCCGFACHRDWRLPKVSRDADAGMPELETIVDCSFSPCINPIFGPTAASVYWSATTAPFSLLDSAWGVSFNFGFVDNFNMLGNFHVRTVRLGP